MFDIIANLPGWEKSMLLASVLICFGLLFMSGYGARQAKKEEAKAVGDKIDALVKRQCDSEDALIAELEEGCEQLKKSLAILRQQSPATQQNLDARHAAVISIGNAERALALLYKRKNAIYPNDRRM